MKTQEYKKVKLTNPVHLLAVGFGSGLSPVMPGTMGSIAAIPIWWLFHDIAPLYYWLIVIVATIFGCWICQKTADHIGKADPGSVVWDEFVGMWIALFFMPVVSWLWVLAVFVIFRFFDILKPWPIGWFDQKIKGGVGIMLDDIIAGIFSVIVIVAIGYFV
ncbi:phosphatidylglycerophosphatase A [Utexia brackfieldae]|uniref:phosphatidylglycerophosphatase A family protein n=1 Tax=Utexia brackfieldae TaxID=3074108 RepID=UPI00370D1A64